MFNGAFLNRAGFFSLKTRENFKHVTKKYFKNDNFANKNKVEKYVCPP